jgi:hydroxymethylpyrimidine pyrophosphatase-like HAD family hydrolase
MPPKYDLIAVDLDGTLLDHSGRVSQRNLDALARARKAGIIVTVCTGRALIESTPILKAIAQSDPVVVSGGAMVACPNTGETLERFTLDTDLVHEAVHFLRERNHPALILKDPHPTQYDYLAITPDHPTTGPGEHALDAASRWWFKKMGVRVRYATSVHHDEDHQHSVRVGAYQANDSIDDLAAQLAQRFEGRASMQHFQGALLPKDRVDDGIHSVHIVELFHTKADKWQAIERLSNRLKINPARTAAIGDQLNDLSMITHAGLGIAMGNARPEIKAVSKRQTATCDNSGVADAIDKILAGEW